MRRISKIVYKVGTQTSGYEDHPGRPGLVGGSRPRSGYVDTSYEAERRREALRRHRAKVKAELLAKQQAASKRPYSFFDDVGSIPSPVPDSAVKFNPYNLSDSMAVISNIPYENLRNPEILKRMFYKEGFTANIEVFDANGSAILSVHWYDKNGMQVGRQKIEVPYNDQWPVNFSYLRFDDTYMNQDLAIPLVTRQMVMCKLSGVKEAVLCADISIGKYAWAKPGVEYNLSGTDPSSVEWLRNDMISKFEHFCAHHDIFPADTSYKDFTHPYQWAQYKVPGRTIKHYEIANTDIKPGNYDVGKAFMLDDSGHGSWNAIIDLQSIPMQ